MVLSGRVRPLNSCLPHVSHGVCQVGSVLPLPSFSQRSLRSFLYQACCVWFGRLPAMPMLVFLLLVYFLGLSFARFSRPG